MIRDNSGSLSDNANKKTDRHPDYTGKCTIGGQAYEIGGWKKEGNYGKFISLSFKTKQAEQEKAEPMPDFITKETF